MFLFNMEFNIKRSNVSLPSTRGFASNSITIIKLIIMAKASLIVASVASRLVQHACCHHEIQVVTDNFNNSPHLGLKEFLLQC
jgi:hypothetical protein